jgi:hypothetical protein
MHGYLQTPSIRDFCWIASYLPRARTSCDELPLARENLNVNPVSQDGGGGSKRRLRERLFHVYPQGERYRSKIYDGMERRHAVNVRRARGIAQECVASRRDQFSHVAQIPAVTFDCRRRSCSHAGWKFSAYSPMMEILLGPKRTYGTRTQRLTVPIKSATKVTLSNAASLF